jgi:hypothetical protein
MIHGNTPGLYPSLRDIHVPRTAGARALLSKPRVSENLESVVEMSLVLPNLPGVI